VGEKRNEDMALVGKLEEKIPGARWKITVEMVS
jgi:hypothetical protein